MKRHCDPHPIDGGCDCGYIRYRLETAPMFVQACHCTWCQRGTGSAFAVHALIESDRVTLQHGYPVFTKAPTASGKGQAVARCPRCHVAVWAYYVEAGSQVTYVRVGTLDTPHLFPPQIHFFTSTKQNWIDIPSDAIQVFDNYLPSLYWPEASLQRISALLARRHEPSAPVAGD